MASFGSVRPYSYKSIGGRGEGSIAARCRREGIDEILRYSWSRAIRGTGKVRLAADMPVRRPDDQLSVLSH